MGFPCYQFNNGQSNTESFGPTTYLSGLSPALPPLAEYNIIRPQNLITKSRQNYSMVGMFDSNLGNMSEEEILWVESSQWVWMESFLILLLFWNNQQNVIIGSWAEISLHFECNWGETWLYCHSNWQSIKNIFIFSLLWFFAFFFPHPRCSSYLTYIHSHRFSDGMSEKEELVVKLDEGIWTSSTLKMKWAKREAEDADDCVQQQGMSW